MRRSKFTVLYIVGGTLAATVVLSVVSLLWRIFVFRPQLPPPGTMELLSTWMAQALLLSAGVGITAMSLIELAKPYARPWFNRVLIARWLHAPAGRYERHYEHDLANVLWPGSARNFLELPPERLTAQIQIAFDALLSQLRPAATAAAPEPQHPLDSQYKQTLAALLATESSDNVPNDLSDYLTTGDESTEKKLDLRRRLGERMQRRLDELQILAELEWRRLLRLASITLSGVLGGTLVLIANRGPLTPTDGLAAVILSAVLGAMFAGVSRDLAATIERLRR